ncbi:SDR family oxidoreductase [Permianibacter sp. IMCC34836]|uniref:SDR family oxidoreductase n=1 Tax=Permianibacter fluminis TaxID=2738515 RepID=UPI001553CF79|nr:SDR family oxidoreductase [Permianibacter fluminis]NQD36346.1 SDR family oxidoreductase [Permianibacter fluminis]
MTHVVAITGAGSGLGRALALRYAARGSAVAIAGRNIDKLLETRAQLEAMKATVFSWRCDVTDEDSVRSFVDATVHQLGRIDVFVNNAGYAHAGHIVDTPVADWQALFDTNLFGVVRACRAVIPQMRQQRAGHLVNIASFAGIANAPTMAAYNASKAALISLSETLRMELHDDGIGVTVACPSFFDTDLHLSLQTPNPEMRGVVERLIKRSGFTAEQIADDILRAVDKKKFLVLSQPQSKRLYWLKRLSTGLYVRAMLNYIRQRNAKAAAYQQQKNQAATTLGKSS